MLSVVFKRAPDKVTNTWTWKGATYHYREVPPVLFCELLNAPSLGKFFNKHIRPVYVGHLVKGKK